MNGPLPNLEEINNAFVEVFPQEILKYVEYEQQENRTVITLQSNSKSRTYQIDQNTNLTELFRNLPHID